MNKNIKIFLDDERLPVEGHDFDYIIRTYDEFESLCLETYLNNDKIVFISFDHDLGEGKNGLDCAKELVSATMDFDILHERFEYYVHSQNPIGAENIRAYLRNFLSFNAYYR